ncbi:hypothetical protein GCM10010433_40200 [Streptomyces pulveraceus]
MAAPTDNGSGPAPIGAAGPSARPAIGATGRASLRPRLPPGHDLLPIIADQDGHDFLLGEVDGDVAVFGGTEAVGFWQPFCFAIAVPTSPD